MYFSRLRLNSRGQRARDDVRFSYEMHRTLLKAFAENEERLLFRIDALAGEPVVYAQSRTEPNWAKLTIPKDYFCNGGPETKAFELDLDKGSVLQFRLRANPTAVQESTGKRYGLTGDRAFQWLTRRGEENGFVPSAHIYSEGLRIAQNIKNPPRHFSVMFEGTLEVTDPDAFKGVVAAGIGRAKAYGYGLLSLALIRR